MNQKPTIQEKMKTMIEVAEFMGEGADKLKADFDEALDRFSDSELEKLINDFYKEFSVRFSMVYLPHDEKHTKDEIEKFLSKSNIKHFNETQ